MVPDSVHKLRPGDIDVIASMGDSLTAGVGIFASNILHLLVENRGVSAAGGGQGTWKQYLTIPNILKVIAKILLEYHLKRVRYILSITSHFNLFIVITTTTSCLQRIIKVLQIGKHAAPYAIFCTLQV